jgi:uncharacterized protein (DUF2249 family)
MKLSGKGGPTASKDGVINMRDRFAAIEKRLDALEAGGVQAVKRDTTDYPPSLDNDQFKLVLSQFMADRKERGTPVTKLALQRIINKCTPYGWEISIKALHKSIDMGWKGVFPESVEADEGGPSNGKSSW